MCVLAGPSLFDHPTSINIAKTTIDKVPNTRHRDRIPSHPHVDFSQRLHSCCLGFPPLRELPHHLCIGDDTHRAGTHPYTERAGLLERQGIKQAPKSLAWSDLHKSQDLETNDKTICGSRTRPRGGAEQASSCKKQFHRPNPRSESESCITAPVRNAQSTRQASTAFQPPPRRLRYPPGRQREQCVHSPPRSPSPSLRRSETTAPIVPVLRVLERRGRPFAARIPAVPRREPLPCLPRLTPLPSPISWQWRPWWYRLVS